MRRKVEGWRLLKETVKAERKTAAALDADLSGPHTAHPALVTPLHSLSVLTTYVAVLGDGMDVQGG